MQFFLMPTQRAIHHSQLNAADFRLSFANPISSAWIIIYEYTNEYHTLNSYYAEQGLGMWLIYSHNMV